MQRINVIYTRFSSDMQRDESCEDQQRETREGLARKGIDARDFRVIDDRAESGTKNDRANYELLRAAIQRGEIGILAVDDQSRLSRADNVFSFITDLVYSGGRFISTGEGIDTTQEGWELRVKVMELHNSTTIRELGRRVRRGQLGRVLDDGSAGDYPFGYESYYLDPDQAEASRRGPKPKKGVRLCEEEARWVRQTFTWFTDKHKAIGGIARELNRRGFGTGHHQPVRRMLANPKYIGVWPWGTTRTLRSSEGKTKRVPVPPEQQIVRQRPELRIIDPATWEKAQQRLRELDEIYGQKPGQKRRGAKPHHTAVYPTSLLGGLLFCHACGAPLWELRSGTRLYMGCANHRKGTCAMAGRVPVAKAEQALADFLPQLLNSWPGWIESAIAALRQAVGEASGAIPAALRADQTRLAQLEKRITNLVDQLADGTLDSPSVRQRLVESEREAEMLRAGIAHSEALQDRAVTMPDGPWIREQLTHLLPLLKDDPAKSARLLRRLVGRITAEAVVARGKERGYIRLRFRIDALQVVQSALGDRLPATLVGLAKMQPGTDPPEFQLDLGGPTRRDAWAPEIVAMRAQGVTWVEIGRISGLGTGNAYNVWKRWVESEPEDRQETA